MTPAPKEVDYEAGLRLVSKLVNKGRYEIAARWADHLCRHRPADPRAHNQAAMARQRHFGPHAAARSFQRAAVLCPEAAEIWTNFGNSLRRAGEPERALYQHHRAAACRPDDPEVRAARSLCLLTLGDYRRGFAEYEHRGERDRALRPFREAGIPDWDRRSLVGRRLLIVTEQGAGDAIQFLRFVQPLAAGGATVIVACTKQLRRLVATVPGVSAVVPRSPPPAECFDGVELLMSLPAALKTDFDTLPAPERYLSPPRPITLPESAGGRLRVGLCWTGSPAHPLNEPRRIPFGELAALLAVPEVDFHSLQVGFGSSAAAGEPRIRNLAAGIDDFADTAAAIAAMDLVITIDTSVAHIAGALGKPVWTLLSRVPDWRWGVAGESTAWYPAMRLFRQSCAGRWADVVERVAAELTAAARSVGDTDRGRHWPI